MYYYKFFAFNCITVHVKEKQMALIAYTENFFDI